MRPRATSQPPSNGLSSPRFPAVFDASGFGAPFAAPVRLSATWDGDDTAFARALYAQYNVTVLPGSYLARDAQGANPGRGRVRMALVASTKECVEAAQRIVQFVQQGR